MSACWDSFPCIVYLRRRTWSKDTDEGLQDGSSGLGLRDPASDERSHGLPGLELREVDLTVPCHRHQPKTV